MKYILHDFTFPQKREINILLIEKVKSKILSLLLTIEKSEM